jgi:hypothetical protein
MEYLVVCDNGILMKMGWDGLIRCLIVITQ